MKSILLDVDEVITFSGFLPAVNEFLGTNYEIDDIEDFYIDRTLIPPERVEEWQKFMAGRNFYENPDILPDAIEVIEKLNQQYQIYICSSCVTRLNIAGSGRMFADKYDFLIKYLPFLNPEHFIFTSVKHLFTADIQIDDRVENFDNNVEMKILFPSYHNKNISEDELLEKGVIRAGREWRTGWKEVEKILLS